MTGKTVKNTLLILSAALLLVIGGASFIAAQDGNKDDLYKKFDVFVEVLNKIRSEYVEQVEPEVIFDGALKGMAKMLDSESSYLTAAEYENYKEEMASRTADTGLQIIKHPGNGYAFVIGIIDGSPAQESGIQTGDFIRAIDGKSTSEMPAMMLELMMKGEPGSTAEFSVIRSGVQGLTDYEIERQMLSPIHFKSETRGTTGIINVSSFDSLVLEEITIACEEFKTAGVSTIIFDVRNNVSRNLEEAIHSADLFISESSLLTVKSNGEPLIYSATEPAYEYNLLVLVNNATGRAAEAFALMLKESAGAEIVGNSTLGIATLQKELILEDGAYLNISYGTFESPQGTVIQGTGITPDIEVELNNQVSTTEDKILQRALQRAEEIRTETKAA